MDQVPHRRGRALNRKTALLLALLAILLGGLIAWWANRPAPLPPPAQMEPNRFLLDRAKEEIAGIAITPPGGTPYPLTVTEEGLRLLGQEDVALFEDLADRLLYAASRVETALLAADTAESGLAFADFGLDTPYAKVTVTYTDGEKAELLIGDLAPEEEPQYYAALRGDSRVYTVLQGYVEDFFHDMWYLRAFEQPDLKGAFLDRIRVTGDLTLDLHYTAAGWLMDAPVSYPVNGNKMDSLLNRIENMGFESCMGTMAESDLAALGLLEPALTVEITQAATLLSGQDAEGGDLSYTLPEHTYTLLIGAETGRSGVYAAWEGMVYKASNFLFGFWKELAAEDFLLRQPVDFLVNRLDTMQVETEEKAVSYRVEMVESLLPNGAIETDEYGNILYDAVVFREGVEMDAQPFLSWYTRLNAIAPAGRVPEGYQVSGPCRARITLQNAEMTREIAFYPYDALHCAMAVNGVCLYYVDSACLDVINACP